MRTANAQDLAAIDRLINPDGPPERIFGWLNSQLSIARYYGGRIFQGSQYHIAEMEDGAPLVRADVLQREEKEKAKRLKSDRRAEEIYAELAQIGLL